MQASLSDCRAAAVFVYVLTWKRRAVEKAGISEDDWRGGGLMDQSTRLLHEGGTVAERRHRA